jgi:hypothetical protein
MVMICGAVVEDDVDHGQGDHGAAGAEDELGVPRDSPPLEPARAESISSWVVSPRLSTAHLRGT